MKSSVIIHFGVGHENETIRAMLDYLGFLREASQKSPRLWWVVTVVISAASFLMRCLNETIRAMLDYLGFLREASQKSPRLWWVVTVVISAASFLMTLIGTPRVVRLY